MSTTRRTAEEARAALDAYDADWGKRAVRKAYAALGDDTTLSRFVKTGHAAEAPVRQRQLTFDGMRNTSIEAGRSLFHRGGVKPPLAQTNVLVSGHSNVKIGRDVRKGRAFRGYYIYTLSLEERATCPASCLHWTTCYGNNMPWAKRVDHRDANALYLAIERDIRRLLRGRVGILVRLHALGDFFSTDYVRFWVRMLDTYPTLAVFGYTARDPNDPIGTAIARVKRSKLLGPRFMIRWSNGGRRRDCTVSVLRAKDAPASAIVCPEQTGRTRCCATCGLCWNTDRNIAFVEH